MLETSVASVRSAWMHLSKQHMACVAEVCSSYHWQQVQSTANAASTQNDMHSKKPFEFYQLLESIGLSITTQPPGDAPRSVSLPHQLGAAAAELKGRIPPVAPGNHYLTNGRAGGILFNRHPSRLSSDKRCCDTTHLIGAACRARERRCWVVGAKTEAQASVVQLHFQALNCMWKGYQGPVTMTALVQIACSYLATCMMRRMRS